MSARPGFLLAARRPASSRECQQLDISASPEGWQPGHRDRPLSFRWKADYATLSRILDLPACRSRKAERAMASIVHDAVLSVRENPAMRISYSRRKAFYATVGRYEGTDYGYDTVVPAIDALVAAGLLIDHDKVKGRPGGTGVQSSFRPAPDLADIMLPRPDYRVGEIIRLKDTEGNLMGYRDTERTARDRRFLQTVNGHLAEADIRLGHINGVVHDDEAETLYFPGFLQWLDEGFGDHTVYTRMNELYRVYNGSWTQGGRFYGGWWQQVRGIDRKHLSIDGGTTVELDYEMLHPRLLYAVAGRKLDGDAYTLDGWHRKVCKRAFNVLLNARTYPEALGAIRPHVDGSRKAAIALIAAMKKRHSAVADSFHSGIGLRLQSIDAAMAKAVLNELTVRNNVTVLPIHDSFIVRTEHQSTLEEAMDRAYREATVSVGNQTTVSRGWSNITPHREGTVVQDGMPEGGPPLSDGIRVETTLARSAPARSPIKPLPTVTASDRSAASSRISFGSTGTHAVNPYVTGDSPEASAHALSAETVACARVSSMNAATPESCCVCQGSETAYTPSRSDTGASDNAIAKTVAIRQREAWQSPNGEPKHLANARAPANAILPPAFLNPANRNRVLVEQLRRLAGQPLESGPTIDRLRKHRR